MSSFLEIVGTRPSDDEIWSGALKKGFKVIVYYRNIANFTSLVVTRMNAIKEKDPLRHYDLTSRLKYGFGHQDYPITDGETVKNSEEWTDNGLHASLGLFWMVELG
ncbi:225_t:CDS:2 [Acaulospora morrowiae]|uniref:225_t:CDS:1 n=1 Tax=Acaulospora morrowiae TaxID=94023 RepID=A0A9N9H7Z7_9GLOM|nr:225_t:CDS:2 [Acaulospora morrowiae]